MIMKRLVENINQILAEWDPIGVGAAIATDEYKGYIPTILNSINDKKRLMECLENILVNEIGLEYDSTNKEHFTDLQQICDKIIQVCSNSKALK